MKITEPLKEEHKEFVPKIQSIQDLAETVYSLNLEDLENRLELVITFLKKQLIPHAMAEDAVLYPMIDKLSNCEDFTKTMQYDHVEIGKLTNMLEQADHNDKLNLQKLLYRISATVSLHFNKEEEIYLPYLDKNLKEEDAKDLFRRMEEKASKIKSSLN